MFEIAGPSSPEAEYVVRVVFGEFLNTGYRYIESDIPTSSFEITHPLKPRKICVSSVYFDKTLESFMPSEFVSSISVSDLGNTTAVSVLGELLSGGYYSKTLLGSSGLFKKGDLAVYYDLFGAIFFLLSRAEEYRSGNIDSHGRLKAQEGILHSSGLLGEPLVDHYVEVLRLGINSLWPGVLVHRDEFRVEVSCDVDIPSKYAFNKRTVAKIMAAEAFKKDCNLSIRGAIDKYRSIQKGRAVPDPFYEKIFWMMDVNEERGNRMTFNFMAGGTHPIYDTCYDIRHPLITNLLKVIHARGHRIGFHPSYNTFRDEELFNREYKALINTLEESEIYCDVVSGRQHVLRWSFPTTLAIWGQSSLKYDSTLYYPEAPGFRSGTCKVHTMYNVRQRKEAGVKQVPLSLMDVSLLDSTYSSKMDVIRSINLGNKLKETARKYNGVFSVLWHNNMLETEESRRIYLSVI